MARSYGGKSHFVLAALASITLWSGVEGAHAGSLETDLGRNETRVRSEAFPLIGGESVHDIHLADRLDALGYKRVSRKPASPGEYFFGFENFRIHRRAYRWDGTDWPARSFVLHLDRASGQILSVSADDGEPIAIEPAGKLRLDPLTLAESLGRDRALRDPVAWSDFPESVWRPLLAIEDARFFEHSGLDGRALARALLANLKQGGVAQGGSTLTQQLIKNRDLSPKRSLVRKASEAVRALALEADYSKEEILEAYLNHVYLGHVNGLAVHGYGAAARVYFSKGVTELSLAESASLAAMVQGPNRLSPDRHAERLLSRRNRVLERMLELEWASPETVKRAQASAVNGRRTMPTVPPAKHFLMTAKHRLDEQLGNRLDQGRGVVLETTLDPWLQQRAEEIVSVYLAKLRTGSARLRRGKLSAALIAVNAADGAILAYVGGDPQNGEDEFDRIRLARRQTGSTIKPLLLLEAFEDCGSKQALYPSTRVSDGPLQIDLPSGPWTPQNYDRKNHGIVDLRQSLVLSYNVPFVRLTRWCGVRPTAARLRELGLTIPDEPPLSLALGALEATPWQMVQAYSVFSGEGETHRPYGIRRVERPAGGRLYRERPSTTRVVDPATAWLVRDLLLDAVRSGTGRGATLHDGPTAFGKTGTSSDLRDAWFAGQAGGVLTVVWVGLDDGALGLTGGAGAAPLWREFMADAANTRPTRPLRRPTRIVDSWVDESSGLRVPDERRGAHREIYRKGAMPRRDRFWRPDPEDPILY